jgi:ABC-2 type transport system ATP-binding protein
MSVVVQNLSKHYGEQKALNQVSFAAKKGEIVGLLGPNGAGKTTTMKILTCFIPQTSGHAEVCGFDVSKDPIEVRKKIGYLPEHNPLYKDMYIKEYLGFVAGLYGIRNKKERVSEMIEMVGLQKEQHKQIQALSKGYRQRVGLAQSMMHDPEVLILDEPTSGLDPNQLSEIRNLIRSIGKEKTVIFSSHIMQEVQAICDRVIIINNGNLVANDSIESLQNNKRESAYLLIETKEALPQDLLLKQAYIQEINSIGTYKYRLVGSNKVDLREKVFNFAVEHKVTLLQLHLEKTSVEDIFQELTK